MIVFFFFNDTTTTEIYTLSLHDALPIFDSTTCAATTSRRSARRRHASCQRDGGDRKSTRLNSSHVEISYAVFCLKKKKKIQQVQWYTPIQAPHKHRHRLLRICKRPLRGA